MTTNNTRQLVAATLAGLLIAAVAALAVQPVMASVGSNAQSVTLPAVQIAPMSSTALR